MNELNTRLPDRRPLRWWQRLWWLLDGSRRIVFNLLFLALLLALLGSWLLGGPPALKDKTALVLQWKGKLVEQRAGSLRDSALAQAQGSAQEQTQLRDVLAVLEAAARDPKISHAVLMLDDFDGAGLASLREVAAAMERFKSAGKPVLAWGAHFGKSTYFLAAHANEVQLDPMGAVYIDGYGRVRNYYRDALDKLGVGITLVRVGTFKSFGEIYTENGPSQPAAEAEAFLYNAMWSDYTASVERARNLEPGALMRLIEDLPQRFAAVGGDAAKLALQAKLVDALKTRDEFRTALINRGAKDDAGTSFRQVGFDDYLARIKPRNGGDALGVVVAEGEISDGNEPPGRVGGLSTAALVRKAREDEQIKAVVLRVNSPGGSAYGSELVRRELELTRAAGKPVVVSMGDVAASGGYWISMAADEVMADPSTITGSIGVFSLLPHADRLMDKLGVHAAGNGTTWLVGAGDPRRPADPRFTALIQGYIDRIYVDFTTKAAQARKSTPEKIDAVAQGRVWTGAQAKERGLVDSLGGYGDALKSAAARAKLPEGYRVVYLERERSRVERLLQSLPGQGLAGAWVASQLAQWRAALLPPELSSEPARALADDARRLVELAARQGPAGALTHCLCGPP